MIMMMMTTMTMMMFTIVQLAASVGETNEVTNICRSLDKAALPLQCSRQCKLLGNTVQEYFQCNLLEYAVQV